MSTVNGKTFANTSFPNTIQSLPTFTDLSALDQDNYLNYLKQILLGDLETANTYLNQIDDTALVNALKLNTLSDTIGAIQELFSSTTTFIDIISAKQTEWQTIIDKFSYLGAFVTPAVYSSSTTYAVNDIVFYNNKVWKCKVSSTGNIPSEGTYWTQYYLKNSMVSYKDNITNRTLLYVALQNITVATDPYTNSTSASPQWFTLTKIGSIGTGFGFYGEWDSVESYSIGDLVIEDSYAYSSIQNNNIGKQPSENPTWWQQEFNIAPKNITIADSNPTAISGEVWFKTVTL